ncbi:13E12 repeat family protein [Mycobacterium deserti]|uniref:13E12 repeat family protein n=1 Tax=Mycobacterium deserti TaxID=2978347 RepID=A0ABT2M9E3_9MYCO|nr:13E12 repeat family protein [Mycobacterium deserti]MCT7658873.1 13E12 repeat family protein [Mycobacterium deserti]
MSSEAVSKTIERWQAACADVAAPSFDELTGVERLSILDALERERRRLSAVEHGLITGLVTACTPAELGVAKWAEVLTQRLRIDAGEARRRLAEAEELGPRTALTGESLEPVLAQVASVKPAVRSTPNMCASFARSSTSGGLSDP